MTREGRSARHDLAAVIRSHVFQPSRPWPDGTWPVGPDWNPGCSCGEGMYFFQWDLHLAEVISDHQQPSSPVQGAEVND